MGNPKPCHCHRIGGQGQCQRSDPHLPDPKAGTVPSFRACPTYLPGPPPTLGPHHCSPAPGRKEIKGQDHTAVWPRPHQGAQQVGEDSMSPSFTAAAATGHPTALAPLTGETEDFTNPEFHLILMKLPLLGPLPHPPSGQLVSTGRASWSPVCVSRGQGGREKGEEHILQTELFCSHFFSNYSFLVLFLYICTQIHVCAHIKFQFSSHTVHTGLAPIGEAAGAEVRTRVCYWV